MSRTRLTLVFGGGGGALSIGVCGICGDPRFGDGTTYKGMVQWVPKLSRFKNVPWVLQAPMAGSWYQAALIACSFVRD